MRTAGRFLARQVRSRPLASFAFCFLAGVLLAGRVRMPARAVALCASVLGFAGLAARRRPRTRRLAAVLLLLVALPAGALRYQAAVERVPAVRTLYSMPMLGRVASEPYTNPDTGRVIFKFRLERLGDRPSDLRVRLYLRGDAAPLSEIAYGQRLSLTGHIWANDPVTNPYEFDFGAYLRRNGMSAMATAKIEDVEVLGTVRDAQSAVVEVRRILSRRIGALFPQSAPLVQALLLGDRTQLSEELRAALKATGTAHLICISGLHVTVLAALLAAVLRLVMNRRRANALAVLLLLPYGALVGFTPSFLRALIMFAILSFAPVAGLPSDGVTRLGAALLASLLLRPLSVEDPGFVLSYSATAGLILLTPPLQRLFGVPRVEKHIPRHSPVYRATLWKLLRYALTLLCASLAAQLASLPGVVAFFGVQPLLALPFNLVCVPVCMLGYLLSVAAVLLSFLWMPAAALVAAVSGRLFALLTAVTALSAALPLPGVRVGRYPLPLILLHAAILLAASELSRLKPRIRAALPLCLVLVAGLSALVTFARCWEFRIVFLDAGQADCAVVTTRGRTYLIDAGDTYTPAADYLSATCLHLDGVFLSHPHQDHAGGLEDVLTAFMPDALYLPAGWRNRAITSPAVEEALARAERMGVPLRELAAGDAVALSADTALTVYGPAREDDPDAGVNDRSMLALVSHDGRGALFTGDLEIPGEPADIPDADVLKVAHHGSDNATSARFLRRCTPELAIISVGENNFGHPAQIILDRLKAVGARTFLTRDCGAITLTLRDGQWRVKTFLEAS